MKRWGVKDCLAGHSQGTEHTMSSVLFFCLPVLPGASLQQHRLRAASWMLFPTRAADRVSLAHTAPPAAHYHLLSGGLIHVAGRDASKVARGRDGAEVQHVGFGNRKTLLPTFFYAILMGNNFEIGP